MYLRHDVRFAFVYCSICRDAWWKKSRIRFFRLLDIDQHQKFLLCQKTDDKTSENVRPSHFATPQTVSPRNDVWETSAENPY